MSRASAPEVLNRQTGRHRIDSLKVPRVPKLVIAQSPPSGVRRDVRQLIFEVLFVANTMFVKARLPHLALELLPDLK